MAYLEHLGQLLLLSGFFPSLLDAILQCSHKVVSWQTSWAAFWTGGHTLEEWQETVDPRETFPQVAPVRRAGVFSS